MDTVAHIRKSDATEGVAFPVLNRAYERVFQPGKLTVGLVIPLENYARSAAPTMAQHLERAQLAERLGFGALWLRDVPFNVPSFGDAGQLFDPFTYLGALAMQTSEIALGVASIVLTLRHPAHVAKAAHSADQLSGGRVLLGIASGDRPEEFPALGFSYDDRGQRFRDAYTYLRQAAESHPRMDGPFGRSDGAIDLLPKPFAGRLPLLITGSSQQAPQWLAEHGDGWMTYPRAEAQQATLIDDYRSRGRDAGVAARPVMEPLYIDLMDDPDGAPTPIHLGLRLGVRQLRHYLEGRRRIGVNHVALNLRFNHGDIVETLETLAQELLPHFGAQEQRHV